jgi:ankyrin repeat protein
VQLLLEAGANVDTAAANGWTPLYVAALSGHLKVVELLLRNHADPRERGFEGWTALGAAVRHGDKRGVQLLLQSWGQPQITSGDLVGIASLALLRHHMPAFAWLAKELRRLYPA